MSNEVAVKQEPSVFALFDSLDDEIILAELENRVVNTWCYHFTQDGKETWGLSKKGVDQSCAELTKARGVVFKEMPNPLILPDPTDPEYMLISVIVEEYQYDKNMNLVFLTNFSGNKRQWTKELYTKPGGEKSVRIDKFWFEKGLAKAYRNAKARAIPTEVEAKIIALAKQSGHVQKVEETPEAKAKPKYEQKVEQAPTYEEQKSSSAMIEQLKKMVDKKLQGDWSMILKEYDWKSKEEAFLMLTIAQGNSILKWLSTMKG